MTSGVVGSKSQHPDVTNAFTFLTDSFGGGGGGVTKSPGRWDRQFSRSASEGAKWPWTVQTPRSKSSNGENIEHKTN